MTSLLITQLFMFYYRLLSSVTRHTTVFGVRGSLGLISLTFPKEQLYDKLDPELPPHPK